MKQKKAFLLLFFIPFMLFLMPKPLSAAEPIEIYYNNKPLSFDTAPVIKDGVTLAPMRALFDALGFSVEWDGETQAVTATKGDSTILLTAGRTLAYVNQEEKRLAVAPLLSGGRLLVPLRFVSESTGAHVSWNAASRTIEVYTMANTLSDTIVQLTTDTGKQGSGVILSANGLIVTNFHVIEGAAQIFIHFNDNFMYRGEVFVAGFDIPQDLAILKLDLKNLPFAQMGDSSHVKPGDSVTAIGSPNGVKNKISTGIVLSNKNNVICSTARIDHGSSGGALFDASGMLVGISHSYDPQKHYFSIPVNHAKKISTNGAMPLPITAQDADAPPSQVENVTVAYENNIASINWDNQYDLDYYQVFESSTLEGPYTPMLSPLTQKNEWYWGYPNSFSIKTKYPYTAYYKIAGVKNGISSPLSEAVQVKVNRNTK